MEIINSKDTYKLLFVNPDYFKLAELSAGLEGLPLIVIAQSDLKTAYIVDTKIPIQVNIRIKKYEDKK